MPVREYECQAKKCGKTFEEYEKVNDLPLKKCRICKRGKVIRLISLPARAVVPNDPRDEFQKIKREAKQIAQKIVKGDERVIADVLGPSAVGDAPNPPANAPRPKQMKDVKKGVIKRRDR